MQSCVMPERLECEVLQKARYINTLTFTFPFLRKRRYRRVKQLNNCKAKLISMNMHLLSAAKHEGHRSRLELS